MCMMRGYSSWVFHIKLHVLSRQPLIDIPRGYIYIYKGTFFCRPRREIVADLFGLLARR
ncbi:hypothetical protein PUN28_005983 [Cardiocondyla obscurior]|uniref:Transposase n=1 Tax=Cardiocondyla obscurior TaxID=286306 RepID=A0AAW2GA71_9HYME